MAKTFKRRRKLIKPGLQLRLSGRFLGLAVLMMGLQYALLQGILTRVAGGLPGDRGLLIEQTPAIGLELLGWTALIFLPLTLLVGVIGSFRIAGPLYRFEVFLKTVIAGRGAEDIRLRNGDELMDIATLLNEATRPLREEQQRTAEPPGPPVDERRSAA
jgi:hypothetical protein